MIWLSETNAVKLTMTGGDSLLAAVATAATAATASLVQSFYHKKRVNLGLIAREGFSNVSYIKKCALQHTKSLKESD